VALRQLPTTAGPAQGIVQGPSTAEAQQRRSRRSDIQQAKARWHSGTNEGIMRAMDYDGSVGASQIAQAVEFVRALREHVVKMTTQLPWIERQDVIGRNARAYAMRIEANALRRDIDEAQILIDRLRRRYLNANPN
jgi:hypothetical protein